jgi:hypothetical protein
MRFGVDFGAILGPLLDNFGAKHDKKHTANQCQNVSRKNIENETDNH